MTSNPAGVIYSNNMEQVVEDKLTPLPELYFRERLCMDFVSPAILPTAPIDIT